MKEHKPFRILVNDNTREVFFSADDNPWKRDRSENAYEQAIKLSMILRSVPNPTEILKEMAKHWAMLNEEEIKIEDTPRWEP